MDDVPFTRALNCGVMLHKWFWNMDFKRDLSFTVFSILFLSLSIFLNNKLFEVKIREISGPSSPAIAAVWKYKKRYVLEPYKIWKWHWNCSILEKRVNWHATKMHLIYVHLHAHCTFTWRPSLVHPYCYMYICIIIYYNWDGIFASLFMNVLWTAGPAHPDILSGEHGLW